MSYQSFVFIVECFNVSEAEKKDEGENSSENQDEQGDGEKKKEEDDRKKAKIKERKADGKSSEGKTKDAKKSSKKTKRTTPSEQEDSEKIQRLIREQAKQQAEGRRNRKKEFFPGKMDERKRREFQMRLREIHDVDRLRRELRKIRTREMTEDDYAVLEPWERDMDSGVPDEVRRDMRRRRFERMEDPEDMKRELRMRIIELDDDDDDDGDFLGENSFAFRELRHRYMMEAEEIRDPSELKKRIDDVDALSAILHGGRDRGRRRDRHRRRHRDEL